MLRNQLYYGLKPFIPARLRLAMRRWHAQRLRRKVGDVWPINEAAARKPDGWPGWPDGKQFAVVLTHDVEGPEGLAKVRQLAELEMKHGFRSCFNFIPEGTYSVPTELRSWLVENGFEVGVHDLYHDGKLYRSRAGFRQHAQKINRYLKEWNAVGFRSGFMHHNLEWIHDLDIAYDMSTFDTDPFEPQPDGVNTIFPFFVPAPGGSSVPASRSPLPLGEGQGEGYLTSDLRSPSSGFAETATPESVKVELATPESVKAGTPRPSPPGYIELPYTLPQDSTLFFFLEEQGIDIWTRKTEWIARHGGMVLVNVHPDYWQFDAVAANVSASGPLVPIAHYEAFLVHLRKKFTGQFWQAVPREVSQFAQTCQPLNKRAFSRRVTMVTHSFYESDNRVMRYAEALVENGDQVEIFCLKKRATDPDHTNIAGVHVHRLQERKAKGEQARTDYLWPVLRFLAKSAWRVSINHIRQPYDFLHIHNVPDFMVFSAWLPRLAGRPVILDIHDILPEFYGSKFKSGSHSFAFKALLWSEKISARLASHVIISNHLWLEKYAARTGTQNKCSVFINNVDSATFNPRPRTRNDDRFIVSFPGGLQWHQGLDIAIRAFQRVTQEVPNAELHIYGDGNMKPKLVALTRELGLNGTVKFMDEVPIKQVAQVMADSDLGVVPKRADSFGNEAYSTKIMEFMSVGVPVVISRTKIDSYYFNDSVVRFFESGNHDELAAAIIELARDPAQRKRLRENGLAYVAQNNWNTRKREYLQMVGALVSKQSINLREQS